MSLLNRGRKLFYLVGVALLGDRTVIRGNFGHANVTPIPYCRIDTKLKMAIAMVDHIDGFFGLPTGLFCIGCFTAELEAWEAEGSWCWFEIVCDHPEALFMNATAKKFNKRVVSIAIL